MDTQSNSNELKFEVANNQIELTNDDVASNISDSSTIDRNEIKGLSKAEYEDPNQIRVTIADTKAPIVVLFGPPACGKTMTLVRLARFLNKRGYIISPIRTFRPNDDLNYVELCKAENFNNIIKLYSMFT